MEARREGTIPRTPHTLESPCHQPVASLCLTAVSGSPNYLVSVEGSHADISRS